MSAGSEEAAWDFESYCNTAVEAAQLGRVCACRYMLRQAAASVPVGQFEAHRERLESALAECKAALAEPKYGR